MRLPLFLLAAICAASFSACLTVTVTYGEEDGGVPEHRTPDENSVSSTSSGHPNTSGNGSSSGAASSSSSGGSSGGHSEGGQSWTFLVYMVADTNLEPFGLQDLSEMAGVGSTAQVNIVAQVDRAEAYASDGLGSIGNWSSAKRLKVNSGSYQELADLGELNMGNAQVLSDFIQWGVTSFPADRYAIIFWDHGGGWPGFGGDESTSDHDLLTLPELRSGLQSGMQAAGLQQFALIGFDACLMATLEVALSMRPFGEYLLASEELEPGHGWDYGSLALIANDPSTGPLALGQRLAEGFFAQAQASGTSDNVTLSMMDLHALQPLVTAVDSLAGALSAAQADAATAIGRAQSATLAFGAMPDASRSFHMLDVGDLAERLAEADGRFAAARDAVRAALDDVVATRVQGPLTTRARGVSIYFPTHGAYYQQDYEAVEGMAAWRSFLRGYHGGTSGGVTPQFTNQDHLATVGVDNGTIIVQGTLAAGTAGAIANAALNYGTYDQNGVVYLLGRSTAAFNEQIVEGYWGQQLLVVSQGSAQVYAYLELQARNDNLITASVPFGYVPPGSNEAQYAVLVMVLDQSGMMIQSTWYLLSEAGPGELTAEPGAQMYPLVMVIQNGQASWSFSSSQGLDATAEINLGQVTVGQGFAAYLALEAADHAGNGDVVQWAGTL